MVSAYKKNQLNDTHYDAIVIGSGIGGLVTAALLSRQGKKVIVLEKNHVIGGLTHSFNRKRYEWDSGFHYIGNTHNKTHILRQTFDYITLGRLQWTKIDGAYDRIFISNRQISLAAKVEGFVESLKIEFPEESSAIDQYLKLIKRVSDLSYYYFAEKLLPNWLGYLLYPFLVGRFRKYSDKTTKEVLETLTTNKELVRVLCARYGNYGLPPGKSSFAMHALAVFSYLDGANYPAGGGGEIPRLIAKTAEEFGCTLRTKASVKKIIHTANKATGVELEDGAIIKANYIISNVNFHTSYNKLLSLPESAKREKQELNSSVSHMALYVGLKGNCQELQLETANHWHLCEGDLDENLDNYLSQPDSPFPFFFVDSPSAKNSRWQREKPDISTLSIIVPANFRWFEQWQHQPWKKRGQEYLQLKDKFSQRILHTLYSYYPQLKGKVSFHELSTPLSTKHFCQQPFGGMYGYEHSPERFKKRWLRPASPIKGLFFVGQDVITGGVGASTISALLACSLILKKNVMSLIPQLIKQEKKAYL
ncbi:phytoene desaturase family protein [Agarilytica rhodophyticola]|uniref:phytoene desaturase family protein n=1 Tax=Agarilytica rhodophyticola TaxID=1737490 RepID=UPI000B343EF4|nr:NAD(P)/FAD-dependent oxidoreductase [Agarilytica rhodophyticola]